MLGKLLPRRFKGFLKGVLRPLLGGHPEGFFPHQPFDQCYLVPKTPAKAEFHEALPFPVPPKHLWLGYGQTAEEHLQTGRRDIQTMRDLLARSGTTLESAGRILELGCAAGRMIRWLADTTPSCEVWGTDVGASAILWCQQYLSPPLHFVTTTFWPHLPFEDRYFGLIYAGSVFTHIDDLADAWFLELRRLLRPGGRLYITIHDRNTVAILVGTERTNWLTRFLSNFPEYKEWSRSDFGMFTIGRSEESQVFYDTDFLRRKVEPFFRILSITEGAYGHQSAVLLERV